MPEQINSDRIFRQRLIAKAGNRRFVKSIEEVCYIFADGKNAFIKAKGVDHKYLIEQTLEQLESQLNPATFYRISRKFIVNIKHIAEVRTLSNRQLEVKLSYPTHHELIVSRVKSSPFKKWLNQ